MIKRIYIFAFVVVLLLVGFTSYITYNQNKKFQIEETISNFKEMSNAAAVQYDSIFFEIENKLDYTEQILQAEFLTYESIETRLKTIAEGSYYIDEVNYIVGNKIIAKSKDAIFDVKDIRDFKFNGEYSGLVKSKVDEGVYYRAIDCEKKYGENTYLVVGINYSKINKIAKPLNYFSDYKKLTFVSKDGYILYNTEMELINKNMIEDKVFVQEYAKLDDENYSEIIENAILNREKDEYYFRYNGFGFNKIGFVKRLKNCEGSIIISIKIDEIVSQYLWLTIKILSPLIICFSIGGYIFIRYVYIIKYTDYFTEMKNDIAFRKYLKKGIKRKNGVERYIYLKVDKILDSNDKNCIFDDDVIRYFTKHIKGLKKHYSKVYKISRQSYIFVIDDMESAGNILLTNLKDSFLNESGEEYFLKGSILGIEIANIDLRFEKFNIEEQLLNHIENEPSNLNETKIIDFLDYSQILNEFDKKIRDKEYVANLIAKRSIVPFYQPIVGVDSKKVHKYEVLMRPINGNSILNTGEIIGIAEEENLVEEIDKSIIEQAFCMSKERMEENHETTNLSINLSCKSIHKEMLRFILEMTRKYSIDPSTITFELTETAAIDNLGGAIKHLEELRKIGFLLAIDDFGTGYAHVELLSKLEVDYVKIDGLFIRNVENDLKIFKTLSALVYLAKVYDAKIIAEFVENEEVIDILKKLKIEYGQGYYYGKPEASIVE